MKNNLIATKRLYVIFIEASSLPFNKGKTIEIRQKIKNTSIFVNNLILEVDWFKQGSFFVKILPRIRGTPPKIRPVKEIDVIKGCFSKSMFIIKEKPTIVGLSF